MSSDALEAIIATAELDGDAVIVYDAEDRVIYANAAQRDIFSFVDFEQPQTYDSLFMACVEEKTFTDLSVYDDPAAALAFAKRFRREHAFDRTLRRHADGRVFLIKQSLLPDNRQVQTRLDLSREVSHGQRPFGPTMDIADPDSARPSKDQADPLVSPLMQALDFASVGIALVREDLRIWHFNARFAPLLNEGGALSQNGPFIAAHDPADQEWLARAVRRYATLSGHSPVASRLIGADGPSGGAMVGVRSVWQTAYRPPGAQPAAMILATPLGQEPTAAVDHWLCSLFGLDADMAGDAVALESNPLHPLPDGRKARLLRRLRVRDTQGLRSLMARVRAMFVAPPA